jgi:hypothetical protein
MAGNRPTINTLTLGGANVKNDFISLDVEQSVSQVIPNAVLILSNRGDKYSTVDWHDELIAIVNGVNLFSGYIDTPRRPRSKREGVKLEVVARGYIASMADVVGNLHFVNNKADYAVAEIVQSYNALKGSADPTISIGSNRAPSSQPPYVTMQQEGKSHIRMLQELGELLGLPEAFSGYDTFFDYYVNSSKQLYFEEIGYRSSGVALLTGDCKRIVPVIDSLPVRTMFVVFGDQYCGSLPLEMELGYGAQHNGAPWREDPWSELNTEDYLEGPNCVDVQADAGYYVTLEAIQSTRAIFASFEDPWTGYFYMRFPLASGKWPGQDPAGGFNTYNITNIADYPDDDLEYQGEINKIGLYVGYRPGVEQNITFRLEVVTTEPKLGVDTVTIKTDEKSIAPLGDIPGTWTWFEHPFGPGSAVGTGDEQWRLVSPTEDAAPYWENVSELRFCFNFPASGPLDSIFYGEIDGLRFVKPLVVKHMDAADTIVKSKHLFEPWAKAYSWAKAWAACQAENERMPQKYTDIETVGKVDIPIAQTFTLNGTEMVARTIKHSISKRRGWTRSIKGWEKT